MAWEVSLRSLPKTQQDSFTLFCIILHPRIYFPTKDCFAVLQLSILSKLPLPIYKAPFQGVLAICPPKMLSLYNVALFLSDTAPTLCSAMLK